MCASLLDSLDDRGIPALFYFCGHHGTGKSSDILKTLILQMIAKNPDLIGIAYEEFVLKYPTPSLKVLRAMLLGTKDNPGMLHGMEVCRIIIDGVDECDDQEQRFIVEDLTQLVSTTKSPYNCKLLLCGRSVPTIFKAIQKKPKSPVVISFSTEYVSVNLSIRTFVEKHLHDIEEGHAAFQLDTQIIEELSEIILDKAEGMLAFSLHPSKQATTPFVITLIR